MPTIQPSRPRALVRATIAAVAAVALLAPPAAADPPWAGQPEGDCTVTSNPPFFYAGLVFPNARVDCDDVQNRIRLTVTLTMDGVAVDEATRQCYKTTLCRQTVDAHVTDPPGNQTWCAIATFSAHKTSGSATGCEAEDF